MTTSAIYPNHAPPRLVGVKGGVAVKPGTRLGSTILVAEDDADIRLMLRILLEMKGYRVVEAVDGQEAIDVAQQTRPDIILMDLQLPRLNGFAVTRFVRQHNELREVPIIIVSGHDPAKHRSLALAAGCNEYLLKPIDFGQLERLLQRLLPVAA